MTNQRCYALWDLPVRLFHWLLLAAVVTAAVSANLDAMSVHVWAGQTVLGLVLFRLLWGVLGTRTARFANFVRSPKVALAYARSLRAQMKVLHLGHNPLGAFSVLGLIALTLIQAGTGLFTDDDVMTQGPLAHLLSSGTREWLTSLHKLNFNLLLGMIGLHLLAIALYWRLGRQNLLRPMVTGKACVPAERAVDGEENTATPWMRFVLSVGVAVAVVWLVNVV
ncbi:MAG: cytochrome b/b6 domain-containing protein [Halothiobacillaceae bacterium]|nr:cytochrome b/b6 domain-containing protein [Halothiobacillaceae bacterium]